MQRSQNLTICWSQNISSNAARRVVLFKSSQMRDMPTKPEFCIIDKHDHDHVLLWRVCGDEMRMMLCFKFGQDCERAQDCDWTKQCISWLWNDDNWRKQACPGADCILTNHQLWSKSLILAHPTSHAHKCSNAFWCSNMEVIFYQDLKFNDFSIALDELYFMFISLDITQIWQIFPTLNLGEWVVRESEVTCVNLEWERRASRKKGAGGPLKPLKAWLQS